MSRFLNKTVHQNVKTTSITTIATCNWPKVLFSKVFTGESVYSFAFLPLISC